MSTSLKRISSTNFLVMGLLALHLTPAGAATLQKSFDVGEGGRLFVDTDLGSIKVRAAGTDRVEVEVTTSGKGAEDFQVDFSQSGDDVKIRGAYERRSSWFGGRSPTVRFAITVPERYNVDLDTSGGSITVDDLEGEVRAETSGGSLSFGDIQGPVRGRTSGGSITLDGSVGEADVRTSGGAIRLGSVDGDVIAHTSGGGIEVERARGKIDLETSGGGIRVAEVMGTIRASTSGGSVTATLSEQPQDNCRLTTSGGSVTVYLADDVAVDLDASGGGEKVRCDFDLDGAVKTRTSLAGRINGGGPELYLRSSGGGVLVVRR